ncbi:unnamed protein product [Phytophthora fragariaefolia]|uniref:Unnamed protein product n=1 Tax=Phytophthora fragariaefolia TaxID=1490495 RepID=A0A9W6Y520_9STRA|nr:unnamed protein product [Phytophthora fragariaefolia]
MVLKPTNEHFDRIIHLDEPATTIYDYEAAGTNGGEVTIHSPNLSLRDKVRYGKKNLVVLPYLSCQQVPVGALNPPLEFQSSRIVKEISCESV